MKDLRSSMFTVVVFILANWKEPECTPVGRMGKTTMAQPYNRFHIGTQHGKADPTFIKMKRCQ